jgi:hypothetical protein
VSRHLAILCLLVFMASVGGTVPVRAQDLLVTLAEQVPRPGTHTTASASPRDAISLRGRSGSRLAFTRGSGSDYRLRAGAGFFWTQVEEVPRDADRVILTPVLLEDGSIEVSVDISRLDGTRRSSYASTVTVQPGEWTQLFGPAPQHGTGARVYGTATVGTEDALYLRVEPAGP